MRTAGSRASSAMTRFGAATSSPFRRHTCPRIGAGRFQVCWLGWAGMRSLRQPRRSLPSAVGASVVWPWFGAGQQMVARRSRTWQARSLGA
eukprot:510894-Pyramimonas_sp.AAC.1